ncbi:MAG: hypothetical protein AMXMBFR34_14390 [Myxococcaceae bacterium]
MNRVCTTGLAAAVLSACVGGRQASGAPHADAPPVACDSRLAQQAISTVEAQAAAAGDVVVRGYLWSLPSKCPPCPEDTPCSACPASVFHFGSRPRAAVDEGDPELPLQVAPTLPEELLDQRRLFLLWGRLDRRSVYAEGVVLEATLLCSEGRQLWRSGLHPRSLREPSSADFVQRNGPGSSR